MSLFDYQIYTGLYPDCFNLNYEDAYNHYKLNSSRIAYFDKSDLENILIFDWKKYIKRYNLNLKCNLKTYVHWKTNQTNYFYKTNLDVILYNSNIDFFFKYDLKLENPNDLIRYKLHNYICKTRKYALHIHCLNLKNFDLKKKYLMFCGIGNPHEFEQTLIKYKFNISKKIIYPDHYKLSNIDQNN